MDQKAGEPEEPSRSHSPFFWGKPGKGEGQDLPHHGKAKPDKSKEADDSRFRKHKDILGLIKKPVARAEPGAKKKKTVKIPKGLGPHAHVPGP